MLKRLRDASYELKVGLLGRPAFDGNRKLLDEIDMSVGVLTRDTYYYAQYDYLVMGVNPLINIIIASMLEHRGKSVLVSTNRMQDGWNYEILMDVKFQKQIGSKFKIGYRFLMEDTPEARTLAFLESFFQKMNNEYPKSQYISNSDIAISSHLKKVGEDYLFQSLIGNYVDKLPFCEPKIGVDTLYNRMFNLFYRKYSSRENDWKYATDVKNHKDSYNFSKEKTENAFYHILCPKVVVTSHYHPYLKDKELEDSTVFKVVQSSTVDDFESWLKSSL